MKIKRFNQLNETEINQIPGTQLDKYYKYYKMWCDENGFEYNFDKTSQDRIIAKGIEYAEENNLPNMNYFKDE